MWIVEVKANSGRAGRMIRRQRINVLVENAKMAREGMSYSGKPSGFSDYSIYA